VPNPTGHASNPLLGVFARPGSSPPAGLPGRQRHEEMASGRRSHGRRNRHDARPDGERVAGGSRGVLHVEAPTAALMAATTMPRPALKVAGRIRYWDDEDGTGVRCACHGAHYDTPDEMVKRHREEVKPNDQ
jgi:hypothetical protein